VTDGNDFDTYLAEQMKDPEFARHYQAAAVRASIKALRHADRWRLRKRNRGAIAALEATLARAGSGPIREGRDDA
jgi:hypothetical protein